ncbi:MAG: hypothetical protein E7591_10210 [Ruminococcaceae bacterium]|nr:hypothetical protein [Oscillospiraceae bacterium]
MRKLISAILSFTLLIAMTVTVCSANGKEYLQKMTEDYKNEQEAVKLAVEDGYSLWEKYLGDDPACIDFDLMYQCYDLYNNDIVEAYKANGSFSDIISDNYVWIVPCFDKNSEVEVAPIENSEYGWKIRKGDKLENHSNMSNLDIKNNIDVIFDRYPDTDFDSIRVIRCNSKYDFKLIYFTSGNEEYVYPYFYTENPKWAKSGEIYTAANFIAKIKENYGENNNETQGGFAPFVKGNIDYIIIASAAVLVALVTTGIVIKIKRKKNEAV